MSRPQVNPWLVAVAVMSSTFMEVLDTTVVNVALPHIAGSMSASTDEATWSLTSYLVANAIILPMTGWLANFFGRKRLLMISVIGFTISSFFCGFAPNLATLIVFRIIQGATGGGLQPLSQAILLEVFPPAQRGKAMAFWALGIVVAPMLGPVMGGWLTDNYSWRWVFYINIPIGIIAIVMTQLFVFDPEYIRRTAAKIDYFGMGLLVLGIGSLQIMMDKGQQEDWFSSHFIVTLLVLTIVGIVGLVVRELTTKHPIVDLRVFTNRTYATGTFLMTVLGFVLYGSTVLLPLLMQTLLGYPAFEAGMATMPRGLASFLVMPLVGVIITKIEPRLMLAYGLSMTTLSLWFFAHLSLNAGYWDFFWPMLIQGSAMGFVFIPLSTLTHGEIPREQMGNATSIFNLMRNIGASVGIAMTSTMLARHGQIHTNNLSGLVTQFSEATQRTYQQMVNAMIAAGSDPVTASRQAYGALFGIVQRQATMQAFNDVFMFLAYLFAAMLPLILFMKRPKHTAKGEPAMAH
jgi:MFS transporter, DHA2 family, multidrug resistance protein